MGLLATFISGTIMKPLAINWTKHLSDPQRKEDFEKTLRNSTLVLDRLKAILTEWEAQLAAEGSTKDQYSSPAWSHLQAHRNGERGTLKKVRELLDFY
jgi:hypothetical protein